MSHTYVDCMCSMKVTYVGEGVDQGEPRRGFSNLLVQKGREEYNCTGSNDGVTFLENNAACKV